MIIRNTLIIVVSLMLALNLALLPMPDWAIWTRPAWVLMVLIFWTMKIPDKVNVGVAWLMGMIVDLLTGTVLGEHALAYAVVTYIVYYLHMQLRMYSLLQQTLTVMVFVITYQFILYCIQGFIGESPRTHLYWLSSLTSTLLWPWLYVLLSDCQRRFRMT
jgi:rod shape-determining protein MreD